MTLFIDLASITSNSRQAKCLAETNGATISAVVKEAYAAAPIIDAIKTAGITNFSVSSIDLAGTRALAGTKRSQRTLIGLSTSADAEKVVSGYGSSVHSSASSVTTVILQAARLRKNHPTLLFLRTREDREGIAFEDSESWHGMLEAAARNGHPIAGLIANFGCRFETAPSLEDLKRVSDALRTVPTRFGGASLLSLGGSVLLAAPSRLKRLPGRVIVRVGEAIVAGTIPGKKSQRDFTRPFTLEAKVVECTTGRRGHRLLINRGYTAFDMTDVELMDEGMRFLHSSGEYAQLESERPVAAGRSIRICLGYKSILRAMTNRYLPRKWIE